MTSQRIIQDYLMLTWRKFGVTWVEISRRLNVNAATLQNRYTRIPLSNGTCYRAVKGLRKKTETISKPAQPKNIIRRRCLSCNQDFMSEGPHNRVCQPCKSHEAWQAGVDDMSALALPRLS